VIAGPISDKLGRRKIITVISAVIIAIAVIMPLIVHTQLGFLLYIGIGGFGLGMFLAVDGALMTQVLPSSASRGKDLGVLALPTNAGTLVGPLVAGAIIASGAGYPPVFIIGAVLCVVGAGILIPIKSVR
jgi:MFS family permease